ncbi:hypothetical protein [Arthrobacter sp. TWP1-1]|uniref:hypothetical protein n=1 Tax=Arthrobacter sp. TWP1-1 TaxID=2804568 RepID=UPI003CF6C02A
MAHIRRSRRAKFWPLAALAAYIATIITANVGVASADPAVTGRFEFGETAQLHNGTGITVYRLQSLND